MTFWGPSTNDTQMQIIQQAHLYIDTQTGKACRAQPSLFLEHMLVLLACLINCAEETRCCTQIGRGLGSESERASERERERHREREREREREGERESERVRKRQTGSPRPGVLYLLFAAQSVN